MPPRATPGLRARGELGGGDVGSEAPPQPSECGVVPDPFPALPFCRQPPSASPRGLAEKSGDTTTLLTGAVVGAVGTLGVAALYASRRKWHGQAGASAAGWKDMEYSMGAAA